MHRLQLNQQVQGLITTAWRPADKSSGQLSKQIRAIIGLRMFLHTHTQIISGSLGVGVGSTYLLIKPYPFLTLNHLTVPKTFVAAMKHNKNELLTKFYTSFTMSH